MLQFSHAACPSHACHDEPCGGEALSAFPLICAVQFLCMFHVSQWPGALLDAVAELFMYFGVIFQWCFVRAYMLVLITACR